MSPRWYDGKRSSRARYRRRSAGRLWSTRFAGTVNIGHVKATGNSVKIRLPKTVSIPETEFEWKIPKWSNTIERDRARSYFQAYAAAAALYFSTGDGRSDAGRKSRLGRVSSSRGSDRFGFHEAVRGVLSHHVVIATANRQLPSLPADALERQPARTFTARPAHMKTPCKTRRSSRKTASDDFKGIDIMRTRAQLRSLPAVRRSHAPRPRQDAGTDSLAHESVWLTNAMSNTVKDMGDRVEVLLESIKGANPITARAKAEESRANYRPVVRFRSDPPSGDRG